MEGPKNEDFSQTFTIEKFKKLFDADLENISYEELPVTVRDFYEGQSRKFIHETLYLPRNFDKILKFRHPNGGDLTYIAQQDKNFPNNSVERCAYFADTREGVLTGYLYIRFAYNDPCSYFYGKPFVGFTETYEAFKKEGLGKRRLEVANAYSLAEYGRPLNSDTILFDEARSIWEALCSEGRAEQYSENDKVRFRFIGTS